MVDIDYFSRNHFLGFIVVRFWENHFFYTFDLLSYKEVHPAVLSGGQRQRLAVCQAVLSEKKVVIFDEPTSGLDYTHMIQTGEIIEKLSREGYIVLVITHDYEFLNLVCHSVIQLGEQIAVKGGMQSAEEI